MERIYIRENDYFPKNLQLLPKPKVRIEFFTWVCGLFLFTHLGEKESGEGFDINSVQIIGIGSDLCGNGLSCMFSCNFPKNKS